MDLETYRAAGTQAAPTNVGDNYKIGAIRGRAYLNGDFTTIAGMEMYMEGSVSNTNANSKISF